MRDRGSAGILQVPTHGGIEALDHVTQGVTQTLHLLCPDSALFSICRVSVGHRSFPSSSAAGGGRGQRPGVQSWEGFSEKQWKLS